MLKIEELSNIKGSATLMSKGKFSRILHLKDGSVAKIFTPSFLKYAQRVGLQTERKIMESESISIPEIVTPTGIIQKRGNFCGYTMEEVIGTPYTKLYAQIEPSDLTTIANIIKRLEMILAKGHEQGLVFPDILTLENIKVVGNKIKLIDFDSIQYKDMLSQNCSEMLGKLEFFIGTKYMQGDTGLFTPEIDKLSLLILYLMLTCDVDLMKYINESDGYSRKYAITDLILELGLEGDPIARKILDLFNDKVPNQYIGNDLIRISQEYQLVKNGKNRKFKRK